jgi:hypothetical protein
MGTLRGFPCPPATGLVGQSPPSPTRSTVAGPTSGSLARERGRSRRSPSTGGPCLSATPAARAPSLRPRIKFRRPGRSLKRESVMSLPLQESDGAQGEESSPAVGVRSCSGRPRTDAKRRPRVPWTRVARPLERVGVDGLRPAEPERGKVWKPSQGFHFNVRRAGNFPHPLQPSARRGRAMLSRMPEHPSPPSSARLPLPAARGEA